MRAVVMVLVLAACGPSLPSTSTETDGGTTGSSGASASTTTSGGTSSGGEASTAATGEPTSTTGTASSTSGASTEASSGASSGTGATTGEALPSCCMAPDVANADVAGATPLGPIALTWAWFAIYGGECGGSRVVVHEDPGLVGTETGLRLEIFFDALLPVPGTFPASFTVIDAQGMQANVEGTIDLVKGTEGPFEPIWCAPGDPVVMTDLTIEVSFSIVADGWDVAGKASALYCPQLNVLCP